MVDRPSKRSDTYDFSVSENPEFARRNIPIIHHLEVFTPYRGHVPIRKGETYTIDHDLVI